MAYGKHIGNWGESTAMNSPGQSGDPGGPYYNDFLEMWNKKEAFPLLSSRIVAAILMQDPITACRVWQGFAGDLRCGA